MNIIKECQDTTAQFRGKPATTSTYCLLSTDEPSASLNTLTALFNEAKKDFPGLREEDVAVQRRTPLTGVSKMLAASPGLVSFDAIGFEAPATPPASYKRLKPVGFAQG